MNYGKDTHSLLPTKDTMLTTKQIVNIISFVLLILIIAVVTAIFVWWNKQRRLTARALGIPHEPTLPLSTTPMAFKDGGKREHRAGPIATMWRQGI